MNKGYNQDSFCQKSLIPNLRGYSVETGLDQSACLGQLGHFSLVTQVTGSNYRNQIIQLIFLKWQLLIQSVCQLILHCHTVPVQVLIDYTL